MKHLISTTIILIVLFFIPKMVFGSVVINEIAWMGIVGNQYGEWIELYNNGAEEIDLNNWKLYKGDGSTLIFTLTKKIAPNGYLVIERTTDSSLDPLPTINDESGKFGGSGLINLPKGDHIVLQDSTGTTIEDLNFSSGWPNGDNTTKQTMEKIASGWQTSLNPGGTPKAQNSSGAVEESEDPEEPTTEEPEIPITPTENDNPPVADAGDNIIGFVNQEIILDGSFSYDQDENELQYSWNTGDGNSSDHQIVSHKYQYPGTYLATLTVYDGKNYVSDTITVKIQTAQIIINEFMANPSGKDEEEEWIEIYNDADSITDISGWQLDDIASGSKAFIFPENTLIAPKNYLVFSRQTTKIALNNDKDTVRLLLPDGIVFQEINYEKPPQGKSSARTAEGFVWSEPTPGMANITGGIANNNKNTTYQQNFTKSEIVKEPSNDYVINLPDNEISGGYVELGGDIGKSASSAGKLASIKQSAQNPLNLALLIVCIVFASGFIGLLLVRFREKSLPQA
jgi:PKD repeat protein